MTIPQAMLLRVITGEKRPVLYFFVSGFLIQKPEKLVSHARMSKGANKKLRIQQMERKVRE